MFKLDNTDFEKMNEIAAESIIHGLKHNARKPVNPSLFSDNLNQLGKTFVSLTIDDENIGCMGNTDFMPFFLSANVNAFKSAFRDNRFYRLNNYRSMICDCVVYYLHDERQIYGVTRNNLIDIIKNTDTIKISNGQKSGLFLSMMHEKFNNKELFIDELLKKAKLNEKTDFRNLEVTIYNTTKGHPFKIKDYMEK